MSSNVFWNQDPSNVLRLFATCLGKADDDDDGGGGGGEEDGGGSGPGVLHTGEGDVVMLLLLLLILTTIEKIRAMMVRTHGVHRQCFSYSMMIRQKRNQ